MTIMYTIGIVILSIAFGLAVCDIIKMFDGKSKVYLLPILVVIGSLLILSVTNKPRLDKYYQVENPMTYEELYPEAYKQGYQNAISDAILGETNDYGYTINFNGETHWYSY